jgi:hypothetical protein
MRKLVAIECFQKPKLMSPTLFSVFGIWIPSFGKVRGPMIHAELNRLVHDADNRNFRVDSGYPIFHPRIDPCVMTMRELFYNIHPRLRYVHCTVSLWQLPDL